MEFIADLWLPIVLSSVFVFVASSILHMVISIHKNDWKKIPGEDSVMDELRGESLQPGQYMFPFPGSMKEMCSPEMIEKFKKGPVGYLTMLPNGPPNMNKCLVLWFLYTVLVSFFVAYVGDIVLSPATEFMTVFRVIGTVAVLVYGIASIPDAIWKGQRWNTTLKFVFDGVVYGLVTGITFAWLWPDAV